MAVSVPDLQAAESFYVGVLGMEKAQRWDFQASEAGDRITGLKDAAARTLMLRAGNLYVEVFEFTSPEPAPQPPDRPVCDHGYTHLAFEVDADRMDGIYTELERAGVRWHTEPVRDDGVVVTYGRDPFGNVIEIMAYTRPDECRLERLPVFVSAGPDDGLGTS